MSIFSTEFVEIIGQAGTLGRVRKMWCPADLPFKFERNPETDFHDSYVKSLLE